MNIKELIEKYEYLNHNYFRMVNTSEVLRDLKQLDEPEKVKVPQFVADWIEKCKAKRKRLLTALLYTPEKVNSWVDDPYNQKLFARAYLDGYEVEKEPKYIVKIKGVSGYRRCINKKISSEEYFFASEKEVDGYRTKHTRKELEEEGFGWVFDCEGIEIEEVEG